MTDEEIVRAAWKDVEYSCGDRLPSVEISSGNQMFVFHSLAAARAFTEERLKQIAEVMAAEKLLCEFQMAVSTDDKERWNGLQALYSLVQRELTELKRGMKG